MVAGEIVDGTTSLAEQVILKLGSIGLWLQTIGLIFVLWLTFQIINWIINRKRIKRLDSLVEKLDNIEKKLDKAIKKNSS